LFGSVVVALWLVAVRSAAAMGVSGLYGKGVPLIGRMRAGGEFGRLLGFVFLIGSLVLLILPLWWLHLIGKNVR
jgi:hypothetical protein